MFFWGGGKIQRNNKKYKKLDSKLKEKDKWIYYDEYGWGNLVPRNEKEFNKEEFINEFTYAYEDI